MWPADNGAAGPFLTNGRDPGISLDIQPIQLYNICITRLDSNLPLSGKGSRWSVRSTSRSAEPQRRLGAEWRQTNPISPAPTCWDLMASNKPNLAPPRQAGKPEARNLNAANEQARRGAVRQTNPIDGPLHPRAVDPSRQTKPIRQLYRPQVQGAARQTKPIRQLYRPQVQGAARQTKPIRPGSRMTVAPNKANSERGHR